MAQTRLGHQEAWESLGGAARSAAPRPASSYISHQNYATTQIESQNAYHQSQEQQMKNTLQRRPVPYRQYPKTEAACRPAHSSRVEPVHKAGNVPSVLTVGQARQQQQPPPQQQQAYSVQPPQTQPSQYCQSLHPQTLMPHYQHQQTRQQQQQQQQQKRQQPSPPPQVQQPQNSRNVSNSGYVDWTEAASRLTVVSTNTAASKVSAISTSSTAASTFTTPSMISSMTSPLEHVPIPCMAFEYKESPLARLQAHLPVPGSTFGSASTPANRSSMIITPTNDPSLCPEPLRVPRRPVSMGAAAKPHRPELRISTQVAEPTSIKFDMARSQSQAQLQASARIVTPGTTLDPVSADSYRSADYEDYMSPVLASERLYSRVCNGSSDFDLDLNEMLRAELELKLGLMSMGPIHSHIESGGKLSAMDAAADPMLMAEWQRWREYLGEGADEE